MAPKSKYRSLPSESGCLCWSYRQQVQLTDSHLSQKHQLVSPSLDSVPSPAPHNFPYARRSYLLSLDGLSHLSVSHLPPTASPGTNPSLRCHAWAGPAKGKVPNSWEQPPGSPPPAWVRWYGETGTSGVQENPQEESSPMPLARQPPRPPKLKETKFRLHGARVRTGSRSCGDQTMCDLGKLLSFRAEFGFTPGWLAILVGFKVLPFPLTAPSGPRN